MRRWWWLVAVAFVVSVAACESEGAGGLPDAGGGADVQVTADVPGEADVASGPEVVEIPNPYPETRLDPVCVGDLCAAGPDHAPDPGAMGPFPVGTMTVWLEDTEHPNPHAFLDPYGPSTPRMLRVEIWYPTTEEHRDGPFVGYNLIDDAPDSLKERIGAVEIDDLVVQAVRDAPLRSQDGPYPLVIFSHGAFGVRFQNVFQTVPLASHGYIVVSPDHQYNTTWEYLEHGFQPQEVANAAQPRVYDGQFLIDTMAAWAEDPESMWYQRVAMERVGITGHSFGGFLSMVVGAIDERVDTIIPLSPAGSVASIWGGVDLRNYPIPVLMMGGDEDRTLSFDTDMWKPYQRLSADKAFLRIFRGGHYTFSDMCSVDVIALAEDLGWSDAEQSLNDGCGAENFDPAQARAIISYYTNAWFNHFLRQSPGSWELVNADRVADHAGEVEFLLEFAE